MRLAELYQQGEAPRDWYARARQEPGFRSDPAQERAVQSLQRLYEQLLVFKAKRERLFGKSLLPQPDLPRGLYFWGGVGRGKSFLMDCFFAGLPYTRKRRVHFHEFMREVHVQLGELKHQADPLAQVAASIARKARVLCFDEFHVSDIADAMILQRLFRQLFAQGVVMVLTSNYPPDELYPDGLKRQQFLPAIELLKTQLDVLNIDGNTDYRRRPLTRVDLYLTPNSDSNRARLEQVFDRFAEGPVEHGPVELFGRQFRPLRRAPGVIWFSFQELCVQPRAQMDYLELAKHYSAFVVSEIPVLTAADASAARRFTWLVDVLYDQRVKLALMAAGMPETLYPEGVFANEFTRIASRLQEMSSAEYLAETRRTALILE